MAGIRVTYFKDAAGKDRVRISGRNGEPMFTSEAYERQHSARQAIVVLQDAFQLGQVDVITEPSADQTELEGEDAGAVADTGGATAEPGLE